MICTLKNIGFILMQYGSNLTRSKCAIGSHTASVNLTRILWSSKLTRNLDHFCLHGYLIKLTQILVKYVNWLEICIIFADTVHWIRSASRINTEKEMHTVRGDVVTKQQINKLSDNYISYASSISLILYFNQQDKVVFFQCMGNSTILFWII